MNLDRCQFLVVALASSAQQMRNSPELRYACANGSTWPLRACLGRSSTRVQILKVAGLLPENAVSVYLGQWVCGRLYGKRRLLAARDRER
jgi:hypothetical protein